MPFGQVRADLEPSGRPRMRRTTIMTPNLADFDIVRTRQVNHETNGENKDETDKTLLGRWCPIFTGLVTGCSVGQCQAGVLRQHGQVANETKTGR